MYSFSYLVEDIFSGVLSTELGPSPGPKGTGTRDQIANICWIIEKAREFQKNIYFCFIDYAKAFDCVDLNKLWKILKDPLGLALGSPIFPSGCEGKLGVALESLQGLRDLT